MSEPLRNALSVLFFYGRLLPLLLLRGLTGLLRHLSPAAARAVERPFLPLFNRLFRPVLDPERCLSMDAFTSEQDISDLFTLLRRVGIYDEWFRQQDVLDVGCGPGTFTVALAQRGPARMTGIDIAAHQVAHAAQLAGARQLANTTVETMSVYDMSFPDGRFDRVISQTVFEHLPDVAGALQAIHRVLKPGGEVFFTIDSFRSRYGAHLGHFVHIPWPCAFFSEESAAAFWHRRCAEFKARHHLAATPELLDFSGSLPSLNRMKMADVEKAVAASPFECVALLPYGQEQAILRLFPFLRRWSGLYEYLRGSLVVRLRKPAAGGRPA